MTIAPDVKSQDVTTEELLERARALRPIFSEKIEETERLTHIPEDLHEQLQEAGFYQLLTPKRYGGHEVDLPTYVKIWTEIARGDMSGAWNSCLAANHALQLASWFPEQTQEEIFRTPGGMKAASVAAPLSSFARKVDGGWELDGKVSYCSGIPYSTHYMGQALTEPAEPGGPPGPPILFWAPRDTFEILDDWGKLTGLVGSGSNSIVFDKAFVPDHYVLAATHMADVDPGEGTIGYRLHGNPMYNSRGLGFFTMTVGGIMVGGAYGALDEFKHILMTRDLIRPPFGARATDPDHQRWYGAALTKITVAEGALQHSADMQMDVLPRRRGRPAVHVARRPVRRHRRARGLLAGVAGDAGVDLPLLRLERRDEGREDRAHAPRHGHRLEPLQHGEHRLVPRRARPLRARPAAHDDFCSDDREPGGVALLQERRRPAAAPRSGSRAARPPAPRRATRRPAPTRRRRRAAPAARRAHRPGAGRSPAAASPPPRRRSGASGGRPPRRARRAPSGCRTRRPRGPSPAARRGRSRG